MYTLVVIIANLFEKIRLSLQDFLKSLESQRLLGFSFLHWLRCANPPEPRAVAGASRLGSPTKESGAPQISGAKKGQN